MTQVEVTEEVGMHFLGVLAGAGEPEANRHLGMLEEQAGIGDRQTQIDGQEDLSAGRAEMVQRRAASAGKALATGLTFEPLDAVHATFAITDQRMKGRIRVAEVVARQAVDRRTRRCRWSWACRGCSCVHARARRPVCGRCRRSAWDAGDHTRGNRGACVA